MRNKEAREEKPHRNMNSFLVCLCHADQRTLPACWARTAWGAALHPHLLLLRAANHLVIYKYACTSLSNSHLAQGCTNTLCQAGWPVRSAPLQMCLSLQVGQECCSNNKHTLFQAESCVPFSSTHSHTNTGALSTMPAWPSLCADRGAAAVKQPGAASQCDCPAQPSSCTCCLVSTFCHTT